MITHCRPVALALGCLVAGASMGVAAAQVVKQSPAHYLNSGLFTVNPGEGARFSVALDDYLAGPPAQVTLQFYNEDGAALLGKTVTIQPGQSALLETNQPGVYRVHARIVESSQPLSDRRVAIGGVEVHHVDSLVLRRYICVGGLGRVPDAPVN